MEVIIVHRESFAVLKNEYSKREFSRWPAREASFFVGIGQGTKEVNNLVSFSKDFFVGWCLAFSQSVTVFVSTLKE